MDYTEEEKRQFETEALLDDHMPSHGNMTKISASDYKSRENKNAFELLKENMVSGGQIQLDFIISNNCPYYKFPYYSEFGAETKNLHLNREILNSIYYFLENNTTGIIPTDFAGATNAKESYLLHLLKRDRNNEKLTYDPDKGFKAVYNRITINYGKLPYTPEELDAKLESL